MIYLSRDDRVSFALQFRISGDFYYYRQARPIYCGAVVSSQWVQNDRVWSLRNVPCTIACTHLVKSDTSSRNCSLSQTVWSKYFLWLRIAYSDVTDCLKLRWPIVHWKFLWSVVEASG